jgi:hypothetical protein
LQRATFGRVFMATIFNFVWDVIEVFKGVKMSVKGAQQQITDAVHQWPDVTVSPHRFGGVEYQLGKREIGHIHGDSLVDIPFPTPVRNELVAAGQALPHHILPTSGWISFYIRTQDDVTHAIELLQRSYDLAREQAARRQSKTEAIHDSE